MDTTPTLGDDPGSGGLDRRSVLRRGAILGGALVWTVPAVQTLAGPAFASTSPCIGKITYTDSRGACLQVTYNASSACCDCITTNTPAFGGVVLLAALYCQIAPASGTPCSIASAGPC